MTLNVFIVLSESIAPLALQAVSLVCQVDILGLPEQANAKRVTWGSTEPSMTLTHEIA